MSGWNFADVYEAVAAKVPARPCQVQGDRIITWGQFDARADALAADLLAAGLTRQSKVAAYLFNCPEYLETYVAAFKGGFAPVNTNYRYGHDEIVYLFDNADAEAVVFHAAFVDLVEAVRHELPKVRRWYCVADGTTAVPDWATDYEAVVAVPVAGPVRGPWGRSGDDLLLLYTGGTTGMPKGVMWRQDDLFNVLGSGGNAVLGIGPAATIDEVAERLSPDTAGFVLLSACPLMHGTGQFSSLIAMNLGGCVVSLPSRHFDVGELLGEVQRNRVNSVIIVGQAFAGPILEHLDASPDQFDLSSVVMISSSGVMWSQDNKQGLLRHVPQAALFDSFGSSEAVGMGASVSTADGASQTARFQLGPNCVVHRGWPPRATGLRRAWPGGSRRLHPAGLLQGRGEVSSDVPHLRGPALERARRLGRGRRRWHPAAAGARLGVHQQRRREGVSRGSGRSVEATRQRARCSGGRHPRRAVRRDHLRSGGGGAWRLAGAARAE